MTRKTSVKFFSNTAIFLLFVLTLFEFWGVIMGTKPEKGIVRSHEHFNPALSKLNTIDRFINYCDSMYGSSVINPSDTEQYAIIVSETLRDRFYHGYSYYGLGDNSFAYILAPFIKRDLDAIVIPDDILKHPMAACSQQSIVGMEVYKKKGISVRKVGFFAKGYGGHFCFEAFFGGKWHFFDSDLEPQLSIMADNHFPSISELVQNDSLLHKIYFLKDRNLVDKLFFTYAYGPSNKFPAPRARIFQYVTKFLSYTSWLFFIVIYLLVQKKFKYGKRKKECAELQATLVPIVRV
ncbi:MAG TPA: hypothetical protein VK588_08410 [Chitinophagaceae bacterium]|nr:hypothetical protein [Chitinophagaceae bacterium]